MLLKIQRAIADRVPGTCRNAPRNFPYGLGLHVAKDSAAMEDRVNIETRRNETDGAEVINTTRARQGVTGHNVRYVLTFGIVGVVIMFALAYWAMH
jgi:hypothetical protein